MNFKFKFCTCDISNGDSSVYTDNVYKINPILYADYKVLHYKRVPVLANQTRYSWPTKVGIILYLNSECQGMYIGCVVPTVFKHATLVFLFPSLCSGFTSHAWS